MWKLAEILVGEKQQCQDAKSQQQEQMVLLEKKSATYSQVCQGSGIATPPFILAPGALWGKPRIFFPNVYLF